MLAGPPRGWLCFLALLAGFLLTLSSRAEAQPNTSPPLGEEMILLQEIPSVYGASKYEQKTTEAPASVTIVTADEIRKYGYRTLADILRSVRGLSVTYDRNYDYVGVRGFSRPGDYNTRVLLLVDGHRINDSLFDQAYIGTDFILDVDLIDRVEVIRGPSSSLYGTNALFGVINVITKQGRDVRGAEVSGEVAGFGTEKARLSYGNRFANGIEMLLSGSFYYSDGPEQLYYREFDDPATNNGIVNWGDHDRFYSFFTNFSYHSFRLSGGYISRLKGLPTAPYDIMFNDPHNEATDERAYADLSYEHEFPHDLKALARLYYDHYAYYGQYMNNNADPEDPPDPVLNKDDDLADWYGVELQVSKEFLEKHRFIVGGEYRDNFHQDQVNYDVDPYEVYFTDERQTRVWAFYGQAEVRILEPLLLNLGVRYDHYDTFGGTTNPRIALIYNPFEKTTFKFLFGQAFRAPSTFETYYSDSESFLLDESGLLPERIRTYELTYEQGLGDRLRLVATGFLYNMEDVISEGEDADGYIVYRNVDEVNAKGLELELEGRWPSGLEGKIAYTLQDAADAQTGARLSNSPLFLAQFNLIVPLLRDKFFAAADLQYVSPRDTLAGDTVDGYVRANVTLFTRNLVKGLEASASVYNLFDERYFDPAFEECRQDAIQQDGRNFRIKLTYRF